MGFQKKTKNRPWDSKEKRTFGFQKKTLGIPKKNVGLFGLFGKKSRIIVISATLVTMSRTL